MDAKELAKHHRTFHEAQASMEMLPNYFKWMYGKFQNHITGHVIELGSGAGLGIRYYEHLAQSVTAVDHNDKLLDRIRNRPSTINIDTVQADLLDDWSELEGLSGDTVIMMDVLEHFNDDVLFLKKANELLDENGSMIVKVPAQKSLYSDIDVASGHYRRYDLDDLKDAASQAGLRVSYIRKVNPVGAVAYRFKRKANSSFSKTFSPNQLKVINRLIPLLKIADLLPVLPGLSVIALLKKT